jgi:hypothetical protein
MDQRERSAPKKRPAQRGPVVAEQRQAAYLPASLAFAPFCGRALNPQTT